MKKNKKDTYDKGEIVRNSRDTSLGVVLKKSENNPEYWQVLSSGEVVTWFEHNIERIDESGKSGRTNISFLV